MNPRAVSLRSQKSGSRESAMSAKWISPLLGVLPFLVLYWCDLARHQLWFDELNAWTISAVSPNVSTLARYVHYEGHPWLWYFLLWVPSRFSAAPVMLKWVQVCIGTAVYLVLALRSPFTWVEKVLIYLSYFIVFEYTVMSRMYGLMLLLGLLYAWRRTGKPNDVVAIAIILGVMANTDMTGLVLSGALLVEYAYAIRRKREPGAEGDVSPKRLAAALVVYCALVALSVHSALPAKDISWQSNNGLFTDSTKPTHVARAFANVIAGPWWPISAEFPRRFWETDASSQHALGFLAPLVLIAYWRCFRGDRGAQWRMTAAVVFTIVFVDLVYIGRVRHWGATVIAFLISLWLMRAKQNRAAMEGKVALLPASAYALLGLSVIAGCTAVVSSWTHPFSQSAAAAQWLREHHLADGALVGDGDVSFSSVAEQLRRPVYYLECGCIDRFKLFSADRGVYPISELPDRLALATRNLHTDQLTFLRWRPLEPSEINELAKRSMTVTTLAIIDGADSRFESYWIYRITKQNIAPSGALRAGA